ncbi:MAG: energy transducer TonB [Acidobacteria bacterium ACB1]|nr:energy transducer TonB [Acidobacteria bacterium ACB1]
MLDQLVESKNNSPENRRKGALFLVFFVLVFAALVAGTTVSLFGKDYGMGSGDLELTALVAPPPPDEAPPPKEEKQPEQKRAPDVDIRKELIANINSTPPEKAPPIETTKKNFVAMRENVKTMQGNQDVTNLAATVARGQGAVAGTTTTFGDGKTPGGAADGDDDLEAPPKATPKPAPKTVSGGVLNGRAVNLVQPRYPATARAMHAAGTVTVQVLIDEHGNVVSATPAGGNPLLVQAAVDAARRSKFSPTLLSGQPVKVSGVIRYTFNP